MQTGTITASLVSILYGFFALIPSIAVAVRRMHDTGRSGWSLWAPMINVIFLCLGSERRENRYGPILWLQSYLEVLCMGHNSVRRLEVREKQAQLPDRPLLHGKTSGMQDRSEVDESQRSRLIRPMLSCH